MYTLFEMFLSFLRYSDLIFSAARSQNSILMFIIMMFTQVMTTFMPPPPAATFLAFHPLDNNIIAIGMEDSTIQIYNVRVDEVCFHASSLLDHATSVCLVLQLRLWVMFLT